MSRLGELLVAAGVIGPAQLEEGLRAQVIHGARLGTNLVELGHAELDQVAVGLARQHGLPPAMRRHFERCDPDVQALLPATLAGRYHVVPIGYLAGDSGAVMIACRDPLPEAVCRELAGEMGLGTGKVVLAICGELRIRYFLERAYAIPRPNRFLRVRRSTTHDAAVPAEDTFSGDHWDGDGDGEDSGGFFPAEPSSYRAFDDDIPIHQAPVEEFPADPFEPSEDFHIEETPVDHIIDPPAPGTSWRRPQTIPAPPPPADPVPVELAPSEHAISLGGEELRRFVETLADPETSAPMLGRIAIRKAAAARSNVMTASSSGSGEVAEAADLAQIFAAAETIDDIARAIRRGHSRNRVGELAIGALRKFGTGLDAGVLFVVRDAVAIGWKGFSRGVTDLPIDSIAIPLDASTVIASSAREGRALMIDGAHGTDIDRRLWDALGKPSPGQIAVAPVLLADQPVCLVYGQAARMAPFAELFAAVTGATTSAFARLLRAAQR